MLQGCTPLQYLSHAPIPLDECSIPLAMNVEGVHTLPIFIVCPYSPCQVGYTTLDECWKGCTPFQSSSRAPIPTVEGYVPLAMNVGGVYTLPIFIACPYAPCRVVYTPCDECWRCLHPSNIHHVPLYPLLSGLYPCPYMGAFSPMQGVPMPIYGSLFASAKCPHAPLQ